MKVWMVAGGYDCEGYCGETVRLFDCKSTAVAYRDELKEEGYDYIYCEAMDVCMESMLAA